MDKHMWDFLASGLASGSGPKAHITLKTGRIVNICELKSETRALSCKIRFDTKLTTRIPIQLIGEKYLRDRIVKYLIDHVNEVKVMQVVNDDKHELPDYCTLCYGSHSFTSCRNCRYCYGSDHQAIDCILLQNKMDYLGQTDKPDKKFVPLDKMSKSNRKCWNRKQKCGFVMEAYFRLSPLISTIVPPYDNFNDNMIYYSIDVEGAQVQVNGVNSNVAVQVVLSARFANQMKITSIFSTYIRKPKGLYDTMITVSGVNVAVLEDKTKTLPIEDVRKHLFHYVCNNTLVGHTLVKSDLAMLGITIAELNQIKCKTIDIKDLFGGLSLKDIAFANLIGKDRKPLRIQEYQKSTTSRPLSGHNCEVDCRVTLKAFHKWKFATLEEKQMMANAAKALAFIKANL
ncbi:unnamed protein product [Medioppia subpectinata]|uniref:Exonuclease domain-containing protein n=1 Tax=Medioppia subpectinata TaxID=1979941 RepID=A0A7R9KUU1_9ACAR|nr:unnamed protein product [Medioppia subpectinata]CAG2110288.1 unnamed protein product [Medioppia subpectinata]